MLLQYLSLIVTAFIHKLGLRGGAKFVLIYLTAHVRSGLSSRKIFHVYRNVNMLGHAATVVDLCGSSQTSGKGQMTLAVECQRALIYINRCNPCVSVSLI